MAETYKNVLAVLPNSFSTVYTCPAGRIAIVLGLQSCNVSGAADTLHAQVLDASNANAVRRLASGLPVPSNGAVDPVVGKVILEAGDAIQMKVGGGASNTVEVVGTVLEIY